MCSVAPFKGLVEFSPSFSPPPQISHVVFDFDGTLSWLRHGWPLVMLSGTADGAQSSKQAVIVRLLREEGLAGEHLLAFGDGPVEIQLTKDAGDLAVAVASDEERNGSGRMHPQKHKVLAAAGADVLIPDYRDAAALLECILGEQPRS